MVEFVQSQETAFDVKPEGLFVDWVFEEVGHVAQVLEEGGVAESDLILSAGQTHYFVEEVSEGEDDDTGFFVHDFEEPSDLEGGHVEDVDGVVFLGAVGVLLFPDEVFELDVVALAQQLHELEQAGEHSLL